MSNTAEHIEQARIFKNMLLGKFDTRKVIEVLNYFEDFKREYICKQIEYTKGTMDILVHETVRQKSMVGLPDFQNYKKKGGGDV